MKKEKVQRFSLRKMSVGLVSAVIGSIFLSFQSNPVLASEQQKHTVNYEYVSEEELTEQEKQLIVKELPKIKQGQDSTYYLIYRPTQSKGVLPATGSNSNLFVSSAAILFIVVGIAVGKNAKCKVSSVLLVTILGSALISPSALALSSQMLAKYNQILSVNDNDNLPAPLTIPNYRYIGYIKFDNEHISLPTQDTQSLDNQGNSNNPVETHTQSMPFQTVYEPDNTLSYGQTKEIQTGQLGEKVIVKRPDTNEIISETITKEPINHIVAVGVKPTIAVETLPYSEQRINDDTIETGKEVVEQEGKQGTKTTEITYTLNKQTGQVSANTPTVTVEAATDKIIKVGTKVKEVETRQSIPFETIYQANPMALVGQTKDLQVGQLGEKLIVRREDTNDIIRETVIKEPINHIVSVGTRPVVVTEDIPYNEQRIDDDTLEEGSEVVAQDGVNGLKTTTTTYTLNTQTGQVIQNAPTVTIKPAIDKIIKVGRKVRETESRIVIPFETIYQADNTVPFGQTIETRAGENGEKVVVKQANTNTVIRETITKEAVSRIVTVGTRPTVTTEVIPYNEQRIDDNTLEQGREVIEQVGQNGTKTTTITYTLNTQTGQVAASEPVITQTPATDQIIKVGKKLKQKPVVTVPTVTKNIDSKSVTLTFNLDDVSQTYQSAKVKLYKGTEFIRDIAITNINEPLTIDNLEYFTTYTLKTEVSYDLGNGIQSDIQQTTEIELEYKKIEFKQVESVELYKKVGETYQLQSSPQLTDDNINSHFIKVNASSGKTMWLPISHVTEEQKDGIAVYKVRVDLPELVQDEQGTYKNNTVFYIPKDSSTSQPLNRYQVNYTTVPNATAERAIAYQNTEKLLPFYNKEYIVRMGNQILPSQKLYQTTLRDVVPMVDNRIITDVNTDKTAINRLMLHYSDNTVEYIDIAYKEDFTNNRIAEYNISGTTLLYTPEVMLNDYTEVVNAVLPTLTAITLDSPTVRQTLNIQENDTKKSTNDLYLDDTFNTVKQNLETELKKVLSSDAAINTPEGAVKEALIEKIKTNATPFLLGLTYLNKWYNINYGDINVKDLSAYKLDFFGNQQVSTIDYIIRLGSAGYGLLKASNNVQAFSAVIGTVKNKQSIFDYVESYRQLLLPNKSNNEWLKENSKAYIIETVSNVDEARQKQEEAYGQKNNKYSLGVYDRIASNKWRHPNMLLPLLTQTQENVFVISNMAGITFGGYERYTNSTPLKGDEFNAYMRERVDKGAKWQQDYLDIWYRILEEPSRDRLFASILTYDGFNYANSTGGSTWRTLHDKDKSIQEFFGPVGRHYTNNGLGAYATGTEINYVSYKILDPSGGYTFTHEMTHNFDGIAYFSGKGRREGLGAELFAQGLLETPEKDMSNIGINMMFNYGVDDITRYHAANPVERYQSMADLDEYIKRMFDVVYTLDNLEANATLKQSNEVKKKWLRVIENKYIIDKDGNETHAANKIRRLSDDEVQRLHTLDDLVEYNILNRRSNADIAELKRNSYYAASMFSPIYAALSNEKGAPGDLMFRRMAFELWAAKGYRDGFLPYVSNQYAQEAFDSGSRTWSGWFKRYVGLVNDTMVFNKVFNNEYKSWSEFKKAMYKERIDKVSRLKPITIQYELGVANSTKEVTITSFQQMQNMIDAAMALDMTNIDRTTSHTPASWVNLLKTRIYNAYLRQTNDFRTSIYTDES